MRDKLKEIKGNEKEIKGHEKERKENERNTDNNESTLQRPGVVQWKFFVQIS